MNSRRAQNLMKTDVRETADAYEMKVELPGFKKENVKISLENGYLTIYAEKNSEEEKGGRFIRRERYCGACQRSFYVGDEIHEDQIRAEFRHGILKIDLPKKKRSRQLKKQNIFQSNSQSRLTLFSLRKRSRHSGSSCFYIAVLFPGLYKDLN